MKENTEFFRDAIATIRSHADALSRDAVILSGLLRISGRAAPPEALAQRYGLTEAEVPESLVAALNATAASAGRWAGHVETALAEGNVLSALAFLASAMTSVDRTLNENWPLSDDATFTPLSTRLAPIYARAETLFALGTEPPDNSKIDAYSAWLASHPNPFARRSGP